MIVLYMLLASEKDQNFLGRPRFRGDAILRVFGRARSFRRSILDELPELRCLSLCIFKCRRNNNLDFISFLQIWHLCSCSTSKTTTEIRSISIFDLTRCSSPRDCNILIQYLISLIEKSQLEFTYILKFEFIKYIRRNINSTYRICYENNKDSTLIISKNISYSVLY